MTAIVLSAVVVCLGALMLGQAVLRLCGFERWSWLAAPVGFAVEMLVAVPSIYLPGHSTTTAALLGLLVVGSAIWVLREPAMRPPLGGFLAAGPVAAMTLVPFVSAGRAGTLGVSFNNDMGNHLWISELYRIVAGNALTAAPPGYPMGPHALVATIAQGLGCTVDQAFAGVTAAAAVLLAWTALGLVSRDVRWFGMFAVATVAGMPFLVAGFYGQGSFKELIQALMVVGLAVALVDRPPRPLLRRWVPIAVIVAGSLSVYSPLGLPWMAGVLGAAVAFVLIRTALEESPRAALGELRDGLGPAAVAAGVLVLLVAPQLSRLSDYLSYATSTSGQVTNIAPLGNLVARLPLWQTFGIWDNPDYRFGAIHQPSSEMWTLFVVVLVTLGVVWSVRRRDWVLPLVALVTLGLWVLSDATQTPYVTAKALVIASPLLLALAVRPLVEPGAGTPRWWGFAAGAVAVVLVVKVGWSSVQALRVSPVGPTAHLDELRSLRPLLQDQKVLFLGHDDYVFYELAGSTVDAPLVGNPGAAPDAPKGFVYGQSIDIDSVSAARINASDWVVAPRDAAASTMPAQLKLIRPTRDFTLWRRTGTVQPRGVLAEGDSAGAIFDCKAPAGRKIMRGGGTALIRPTSVGVKVDPFPAGTSIGVDVPLAPGTYDLTMPYVSAQPIELEVVGHLKTTMPASLDRPGPRLPIGRVTIAPGEKRLVRIGMYVHKTRLTPASVAAVPGAIVATPVGGKRVVPIRKACGKFVDYYEPAAPG